jgi:ribosome-binding protein aMBF1 (putative translation factor)
MPVKGDPAFMAAIRKARVEKEWDCTELGKKIGVSEATINNWEVGRYTPSEENRVKVLKVLGLPPSLGAAAVKAAALRSAHANLNGATAH